MTSSSVAIYLSIFSTILNNNHVVNNINAKHKLLKSLEHDLKLFISKVFNQNIFDINLYYLFCTLPIILDSLPDRARGNTAVII